MAKQTPTLAQLVWSALTCLSLALIAAIAPVTAHAEGKQGSWHVELESRADSTDGGRVTYRLTAEQSLVQPESKPILTVSSEALTFAPLPGAGSKVSVIKYLSGDVTFREPDLTCDSVTIRLLPPSDTHGIAAKPALHFRQDFRAPGFSFQLKIPRGFHYVAGSAHSSRVSGLPMKPPRPFVKPPQYAAISDPAAPHLLSILLPTPEPRAVGTGFEAPYAVEFVMAPD
jgi:hypothetical protein